MSSLKLTHYVNSISLKMSHKNINIHWFPKILSMILLLILLIFIARWNKSHQWRGKHNAFTQLGKCFWLLGNAGVYNAILSFDLLIFWSSCEWASPMSSPMVEEPDWWSWWTEGPGKACHVHRWKFKDPTMDFLFLLSVILLSVATRVKSICPLIPQASSKAMQQSRTERLN